MLRKIMICAFCLALAVLFTNISYSQDDPATTDEGLQTEEEAGEMTEGEGVEGEEAVVEVKPDARTYSDGQKVFVNSQVKFKLTAKDNFLTDRIEYKVNDGEVKVYDAPFSIDQEGQHMIKYYGVDKIGNKEMEKAFTVTVDNTAPEVVVTNQTPVQKINEKLYVSQAMAFEVKAKDNLAGVYKIEYAVNDGTFQTYQNPFHVHALGQINLKVRAIDNVNNVSKEFTYKITDATGNEVDVTGGALLLEADNEAPVVEVKSDKELKEINYMKVAAADVKYTVTATDDKSGTDVVYVRVDPEDGDEFVPYTSEIQFFTNGEHIIEAKAVDKVGNESGIVTFSVFVDAIPPKSKYRTSPETVK